MDITRTGDGFAIGHEAGSGYILCSPTVTITILRDLLGFCGLVDNAPPTHSFESIRQRASQCLEFAYGGRIDPKYPQGDGPSKEPIDGRLTLRDLLGRSIAAFSPSGQELDRSAWDGVPDCFLAWTHFELCDEFADSALACNLWTSAVARVDCGALRKTVVQRFMRKLADHYDLFGPK